MTTFHKSWDVSLLCKHKIISQASVAMFYVSTTVMNSATITLKSMIILGLLGVHHTPVDGRMWQDFGYGCQVTPSL